MPREAPGWWHSGSSIWPALLSPAALAWDAATRLRWAATCPYRARVPVICVGNLTAGGAGKTPAAMAIARLLQQTGARPMFLTRGYGGRKKGPHLVDRKRDAAADVGDEPLLLARVAPTIVSADRARGARLAEERGASVIVMDDGFQNPGLAKDLSLLVIDRASGVGNGWVMPAGPLRAGIRFQLSKAQALVPVGTGDRADPVVDEARRAGLPVLDAHVIPRDGSQWLNGKSAVAFAGIGDPGKFFRTLQGLGCRIVHHAAFPDHHAFTAQDANTLLRLAASHGAQLVTTEKDMTRLNGGGSIERLRKASRALPVRLRFKDQGKVRRLLARVMKTRQRPLSR